MKIVYVRGREKEVCKNFLDTVRDDGRLMIPANAGTFVNRRVLDSEIWNRLVCLPPTRLKARPQPSGGSNEAPVPADCCPDRDKEV